MLTTNQVVEIKKNIYNDDKMIESITCGIADPYSLVIDSTTKYSDGIHIKCTAKENITENVLMSNVAGVISFLLSDPLQISKQEMEESSFCLSNILKLTKNEYVIII